MPEICYHPSIEGAQHGAKTLTQFLDYAKASGAAGAQPSNFMLQEGKKFKSPREIQDAFAERGLALDGISAHCPFWVHTTAWTNSPTVRPFLPADVAKKSAAAIERWSEDYLLRLLDLAAALGARIVPMFWGVAFGWELATGYPWGFWKGADYDLLAEGRERFVKKTAKLRAHARKLGIYLAHEIHPGTAAMCADDFDLLVQICDGDKCLAVNADPSHCWEGESWRTRFLKVAPRIYACHVKNMVVRRGLPLRMMEPDWRKRGMQFVDVSSGDLSLVRYVELLVQAGYPRRYRAVMGTKTAPLVVEAESAYRDLDATSADGIAYTRDRLCFPLAAGSFEDAMGEVKG
ncbi:MAG: TIM barrel protein [Verrucomicrobiota bacterium]|jgi:sugar phosphate isomerase/epimerase